MLIFHFLHGSLVCFLRFFILISVGSKGIGGTPLYMPPELFGANPVPTEKCDVYAYGVVLFELITEVI